MRGALRDFLSQSEKDTEKEIRLRWQQISQWVPTQTRHLIEQQLEAGSYRPDSLREDEVMAVMRLEMDQLCVIDGEKK